VISLFKLPIAVPDDFYVTESTVIKHSIGNSTGRGDNDDSGGVGRQSRRLVIGVDGHLARQDSRVAFTAGRAGAAVADAAAAMAAGLTRRISLVFHRDLRKFLISDGFFRVGEIVFLLGFLWTRFDGAFFFVVFLDFVVAGFLIHWRIVVVGRAAAGRRLGRRMDGRLSPHHAQATVENRRNVVAQIRDGRSTVLLLLMMMLGGDGGQVGVIKSCCGRPQELDARWPGAGCSRHSGRTTSLTIFVQNGGPVRFVLLQKSVQIGLLPETAVAQRTPAIRETKWTMSQGEYRYANISYR